MIKWDEDEKMSELSILSIPQRDVISSLTFLQTKIVSQSIFLGIFVLLLSDLHKFDVKNDEMPQNLFSTFCFASLLAIRLNDVWNSKFKTMSRTVDCVLKTLKEYSLCRRHLLWIFKLSCCVFGGAKKWRRNLSRHLVWLHQSKLATVSWMRQNYSISVFSKRIKIKNLQYFYWNFLEKVDKSQEWVEKVWSWFIKV